MRIPMFNLRFIACTINKIYKSRKASYWFFMYFGGIGNRTPKLHAQQNKLDTILIETASFRNSSNFIV